MEKRTAGRILFRVAIALVLCAFSGSVMVAAASEADRSVEPDGGTSMDAIAPPLDARARVCWIDARGGIAARTPCEAHYWRIPVETGTVSTAITIHETSLGGPPFDIKLTFRGQPPTGRDTFPSEALGRATAKTRNEYGVEWEGISAVQGTFEMNVSAAPPRRDAYGTYYEVHGRLTAELPFTNLRVGSQVPPVYLRVDF